MQPGSELRLEVRVKLTVTVTVTVRVTVTVTVRVKVRVAVRVARSMVRVLGFRVSLVFLDHDCVCYRKSSRKADAGGGEEDLRGQGLQIADAFLSGPLAAAFL